MNQKLIKDRLLLVPGSLVIIAAAFLYPDYPNRTRTYLLMGAGLLLVLAGVLYRAKHEPDFLEYSKASMKGFGLLLVSLLIFYLSLLKIPDIFSHLNKADKSMDNLWYFIYSDFRVFLGCLIGFMLMLIFLLPFYSRYRLTMLNIIFMAGLFCSPYIFKGIYILLNTENILQPEIATTTCSSADAYINASSRGIYVFMSVWLILFIIIHRREKNRILQQTSEPE